MVIGGDIVQRAIAQLTGSATIHFAPVAFSFGWVAYSFSAILSTVGDGRLMPPPDCNATLINAQTGYARSVDSWILSRLVRDYEPPGEHDRGLTITFFHTSTSKPTGVADHDWVYYSGVIVIAIQLGIAVIPGALFGDWMILILTIGGTILVCLGVVLPQWRQEKWSGRRLEDFKERKREVVCLTRGNGAPNAIVIISDGYGMKLEDLAAPREVRTRVTIPATFALAVLWLVHLLTVQSLQSNAWYPLIIGALGMIQNAIAAGARRQPGALGFHLEEVRIVHDVKVFKALQEAENVEPRVGLALLGIFFPGGLRPKEEEWRQEKLAEYEKEDKKIS